MRFFCYILLGVWMMLGMANAHPLAADHYYDFHEVFEGFGDPSFKDLAAKINTGIDSELPKLYEERLGIKFSPRNHRIIAHSWSLDEPIPRGSLKEIERLAPGSSVEVIKIWREWAGGVIKYTSEITGLPRAQARALASFLMNIHFLGDLQPGDNVMIEQVLKPDKILNNLIKAAKDLHLNETYITKLEKLSRVAVLRTPDVQQVAKMMMEALYEMPLGKALHDKWATLLKTLYTEDRVVLARAKRASIKLAENTAKLAEEPIERLVPYTRGDFNTPKKATVLRAGLLTSDGRLLIAVKEAAGAGLLIVALDAAQPIYLYLAGNIGKGDFEEKLTESAIKGASVGAATAVAVLVGATPGGIVVLAVAVGTYEITNLAIKAVKPSYLTREDLKAFGIKIDSVLEPDTTDTPLNVPKGDSVLDVLERKRNTVFEIRNDSVLDLDKGDSPLQIEPEDVLEADRASIDIKLDERNRATIAL